MRFYIFLLAVLCCSANLLCAESFYIRRPRLISYEGEEYFLPKPPVKISISGVHSVGLLTDNNGDEIASHMAGVRGDIQLKIVPMLYAGIEGSRLWATDQKSNLIHTITRESGSVIFRLLLTPNTRSYLYVLAGFGVANYRVSFNMLMHSLKHQSTVFTGGVGMDFPITNRWYVAGEYRLAYDVSPWDSFILCGPHAREEWGLSIGYSF